MKRLLVIVSVCSAIALVLGLAGLLPPVRLLAEVLFAATLILALLALMGEGDRKA